MSTMIVTGIGGKVASSRRAAPRLALRGRRRKAVQKLLHYLQVVSSQDTAESHMADTKGYTPLLFRMTPQSAVANAQSRLIQRCRDLLEARLS